MTTRSRSERVSDAKLMLESESDVWLATASGDGPHLVPLSLAWDDDAGEVVVCTEAESPTVRNICDGSRRVRLAVGSTMNVLMLDGEAKVTGAVEEEVATVALFSARTGWDPMKTGGAWVFLRIRPERAQAWRNLDEIKGRTIMRKGQWLE